VKYFATVGDHEYEIDINEERVLVDGERIDVDLMQIGFPELYSLLYNGRSYELLIEAERFQYSVSLRGDQYQIQIEDERTRRLNAGRKKEALPAGEMAVKAPIPGLVVKILVDEGEAAAEGQPLLILEAMKMENEIRSPRDCVVKKVEVEPGQRVEQNAALIIID
jgi:biotin carboxyl carrier protein